MVVVKVYVNSRRVVPFVANRRALWNRIALSCGVVMCFSAEASFASGAVVSTVGLAALSKIRHGREVLLGSLPLLFGIHQFEEGVVWLMLEGRVAPQVGNWCVWFYILFAQVLLPALIPWSFWFAEPDVRHRRIMIPFVVMGTALTLMALWWLPGVQIEAVIRRHSIEYEDTLTGPIWFTGMYILSTCVPPFLTSYPWMLLFASLNLLALIVTSVFRELYLTSIWCALAAFVSVLIFLHFRRVRRLDPLVPG